MKKRSPEYVPDRIIQGLIIVLLISVPIVFVKTIDDGFNVPKRALAQFLIFEMFLLWLLNMNLRRTLKIVKSPLYIPLFIFLGFESLSLLWAQNIYLSWELIGQNVAFGLLVLVVINVVGSERSLRRILTVAICTASFVAILGFFQYFEVNLFSLFEGAKYRWGRVIMGSTIGHYNFLAAYLNLMIPSSLMMACLSKDRKRKLLFGLMSLLLLFSLLVTRSRGAWLGCIGGSVVLFLGFLYAGKRRKKIRVSGILPGLVLAVTFCLLLVAIGLHMSSEIYVRHDGYTLKDWIKYFSASTARRAVSTFEINTGSAMQRRVIWGPTLSMIKNNIIIGVGRNNFQNSYPLYASDEYKKKLKVLTHRGTKVHNEYLQIAAELGIAGLLAFLAFLYILLRTGIGSLRTYRARGGTQYLLGLGLLAGIVSVLIHSLVSHPLRMPASAMHFWLFAGLLGCLCFPRDPDHPMSGTIHRRLSIKRETRGFISLLIVAAMILIPVPLVRSLTASYYIKRGDSFRMQKYFTEALQSYQKACSLGCHDSEVYRNIGHINFQMQKYDTAIDVWEKDLQVNPNFPQTYNALGTAYFFKGKFPLAEDLLLKAIEIYPEYEDARWRLKDLYKRWGAILEEGKRTEEAKELYRRALIHFDDEERFHLRLGYLLYKSGQAEEAVDQFEGVIRRAPEFWEAYRALGYVYARSSEPRRAIPYYQRYLALNPDDTDRELIEQELHQLKQNAGIQ